jgi:AcrR family transcriptional regulator
LIVPAPTTTEREQRIDAIRRAAIPVFAAQGFRRTSMADLANAAGVSRPALYQYFDNRADLFRAAFDAVLQDTTEAALAALDAEGSVAERLDGFLQRANGDAYEALSATPFGDELMEHSHEFAADIVVAAQRRAHRGLRTFLRQNARLDARTLAAVTDLITLAPIGLKRDEPSTAAYRRRLKVLATAATGLLDAAENDA